MWIKNKKKFSDSFCHIRWKVWQLGQLWASLMNIQDAIYWQHTKWFFSFSDPIRFKDFTLQCEVCSIMEVSPVWRQLKLLLWSLGTSLLLCLSLASPYTKHFLHKQTSSHQMKWSASSQNQCDKSEKYMSLNTYTAYRNIKLDIFSWFQNATAI